MAGSEFDGRGVEYASVIEVVEAAARVKMPAVVLSPADHGHHRVIGVLARPKTAHSESVIASMSFVETYSHESFRSGLK